MTVCPWRRVRAFFNKIGGRLVMELDSLSKTIDVIRLLLSKMGKRLGEMNNKTAWLECRNLP